jgi:peptidoglycan biosynthesis protein MviN/MurJ (putative lipid II flippase)
LIWLGGMFFGSGTGQLCASTFYAMGDTRTPTRLSIVTYTVYVPAKIGSFWVWGIEGLALSTSAYYLVNFLLQFYLLERRFRREGY